MHPNILQFVIFPKWQFIKNGWGCFICWRKSIYEFIWILKIHIHPSPWQQAAFPICVLAGAALPAPSTKSSQPQLGKWGIISVRMVGLYPSENSSEGGQNQDSGHSSVVAQSAGAHQATALHPSLIPPLSQGWDTFSSPPLSELGFISVGFGMSQQAGGLLPVRSKREFFEKLFWVIFNASNSSGNLHEEGCLLRRGSF